MMKRILLSLLVILAFPVDAKIFTNNDYFCQTGYNSLVVIDNSALIAVEKNVSGVTLYTWRLQFILPAILVDKQVITSEMKEIIVPSIDNINFYFRTNIWSINGVKCKVLF